MMRSCHSYCLWVISHSVPFPQRLQMSSLLTGPLFFRVVIFSLPCVSSVILDSLLIGGDKSSLSKYENRQIKPEHAVKIQNKKMLPERIKEVTYTDSLKIIALFIVINSADICSAQISLKGQVEYYLFLNNIIHV